ncbi:MAG: tetratricopeptide (TPR) repeat protein [Oleispira sp.]|jgi:tetratricopeptide (TPR) repeat protein
MLLRIVTLLIVNSLIAGCSLLPMSSNSTDSDTAADSQSAHFELGDSKILSTQDAIPAKPFSAPTLYSLLVAEVAGQRQQFNISLANYVNQARKTQDPGIAERATRIAQYLGINQYILEAAQIWVLNAPAEAQAHQILALALMKAGNFPLALQHMESVLELAGASQFDYLALNAQSLSRSEKLDLLHQIELLTKKHSDYAPLWMAQGALLIQLEDYPAALIALEQTIALRENYTSAALSKARVLHKLNRPEEALACLDDLHDSLPKHKGIGVLRARILIDLKRFSEARAAFQYLAQVFPYDYSIQLSLGLLHMELDEDDQAIAVLSPLTLDNNMANEAYFYLARIAEKQQDSIRALRNYRAVREGRQFLPAQFKAAQLLIEQEDIKVARNFLTHRRSDFPDFNIELIQLEVDLLINNEQIEEAYQLVDTALIESPNNTKLLYSRGLLAEKLGNIAQLETDLRLIISLSPNNAEAINALGYTLADKTGRIDEALSLIKQAIELAPNNPAIIDSLGWAYYRLGDLDQAVELLQQAFNAFPDHEVAAHLGEVLWQLKRNSEAKSVWQKGLDQKPNSSVIKETLMRFNIDPNLKSIPE